MVGLNTELEKIMPLFRVYPTFESYGGDPIEYCVEKVVKITDLKELIEEERDEPCDRAKFFWGEEITQEDARELLK